MSDTVAEPADLREEVRQLREEQERLRQEQDRLKEQTKPDQGQNGQGGEDKGGQGQGQGGQQGQGEQKPDDKKEEDGKKPEDKKDESKPGDKKPANWVAAHPVTAIVIVLVLVAVGIGGFLLLQYLGSFTDTDDAEVGAHINAVTSRISGTVVGVYIEDNQTVRAGQVLVDIDPRDYKVSVAQAQAQLAQAEAALKAQNPNVPITQTSQQTNVGSSGQDVANAEAALAGARQTYDSSVAQLRQAEANYANAASDEVRYKLLVDKEEVSKEQYDQKLTDKLAQKALVDAQSASADAAKQTIAQRQAALEQARIREREAEANAPRQVAVQQAQISNRQADVQRYQAQLDQALLNLSYCKIVAPVTGVVGRRSVEVGQQVSPGQQLMGVTNLQDLWVTANFKETQLREMKPGQRVTIHVDALSRDFDGYVESLPGASGAEYSLLPPENATGNYVKVVQRLPVRLRFRSEQVGLERLRPGMSVEPKVYLH